MSDLTRSAVPAAALAIAEDAVLHVVFKVEGTEYLMPAEMVLQMESFSGATVVPGAPPFVAGIVQIRGRIVPVVDLRLRFGAQPTPPALDNRIIVGQLGERIVGLLVDSAREVIKIAPSQLQPPPPVLDHEGRGFVKAVAQLGTRVMMLVDFGRVIGEEPLHGH